jgi:hypothetical protein
MICFSDEDIHAQVFGDDPKHWNQDLQDLQDYQDEQDSLLRDVDLIELNRINNAEI